MRGRLCVGRAVAVAAAVAVPVAGRREASPGGVRRGDRGTTMVKKRKGRVVIDSDTEDSGSDENLDQVRAAGREGAGRGAGGCVRASRRSLQSRRCPPGPAWPRTPELWVPSAAAGSERRAGRAAWPRAPGHSRPCRAGLGRLGHSGGERWAVLTLHRGLWRQRCWASAGPGRESVGDGKRTFSQGAGSPEPGARSREECWSGPGPRSQGLVRVRAISTGLSDRRSPGRSLAVAERVGRRDCAPDGQTAPASPRSTGTLTGRWCRTVQVTFAVSVLGFL